MQQKKGQLGDAKESNDPGRTVMPAVPLTAPTPAAAGVFNQIAR